ncbi:hypothetical protein L7F22_041493 [Adiantum nelumboides]|nr:hypothetical protein [Adiantum nelumboides]
MRSCSFPVTDSPPFRQPETSFHGSFCQRVEPSFNGELDLQQIGCPSDSDTEELLIQSPESRGSASNRRRRTTYTRGGIGGSCVPWMQEKVTFACAVCGPRFGCIGGRSIGTRWWSSTKITIFGLRKDGHTWEQCEVANEHLKSVYLPPPLWKRMLRRLRARARRADCWSACYQQQPGHETFYYDPGSYALNFDDSNGCMQHHQHQVYCPHGSPLVEALDTDSE